VVIAVWQKELSDEDQTFLRSAEHLQSLWPFRRNAHPARGDEITYRLKRLSAAERERRDLPRTPALDCGVTCPKSCPTGCDGVRFGAPECAAQKKTAPETLKIPRRYVKPRSL
jgi:hypothetical protein